MRVWQTEHVFEHNWETVVQAAMNKYPNPLLTGIMSQDVVSRSVSPDGSLKSHRLFGIFFTGVVHTLRSLGLGRLFNSLNDADADVWYGSEHSVVDPKNRRYILSSENITFSHTVTLQERLEYRPHPDDPLRKTILQQSATITCKAWPVGTIVEAVLENAVYSRLAANGPNAIEWVIANRL